MADEEIKQKQHYYMCSFCGVKSNEYSFAMIAGPGGCICQDRLLIAVEIVFSKAKERSTSENQSANKV